MMQERKIHIKTPSSGGYPQKLVFFLHGYGADGNDLFDLSKPFSMVLPFAKFISPDAPYECKMSTQGKEWFPIEEIPYGAKKSAIDLLKFIRSECKKEKLDITDVILIGFSQGAIMSIQSLLISEKNFFAIICYSGGISIENIKHKNSKTPILLIHGEEDQVVPFEWLKQSEKLLSQIGFVVETFSRPNLGHGIDPEGVTIGMEFLKKLVNN